MNPVAHTSGTSPAGRSGSELYDLAELYDIAYDWDLGRELAFYIECMNRFGDRDPRRVLEPACGTGRNLVPLVRMDLKITGYDVNRAMLKFARNRVRKAACESRVDLHLADMRDFRVEEGFDGAFNSINSFRYLISDEDVALHLRRTAAMLRPGSVYVVDFSYAMPPRHNPRTYRWQATRGSLEIDVCWETREAPAEGLSHERCILDVRHGGSGPARYTTRHLTRLWYAGDFERISGDCGFDLVGVYDYSLRRVPPGNPLDGRLENLYHILCRR